MDFREPKVIKTSEQGLELALDAFRFTTRVDPTRVSSLRVSSFPFCSTKWLLSFPMMLTSHREETFNDTFYTGIGTHVHTQIQSVLDSSKFVIRDWVCAKCNHRHRFCLKPKKCAGCYSVKSYMQPMEHELKIGCVTGHIDDAFVVEDGIEIMDYKTTGDLSKKSDLPHKSNVYQIEAYSAIKKKQGYNITSWTLAYIARSSGKRHYSTAREYYGHSFEKEYPKILKRIKTYVRDYKQVSGLTSSKDVAGVLARRRLSETKKDPENLCGFCQFRELCPSTKKVTKVALKVFDKVKAKFPVYTPIA